MTSPLSAENISVSFGGNHVLSGLDLQINRRFTGLIGPNGAGKSTQLRIIMGEAEP
ncbi:MAG: ATP-binding cassette domain-containing protein, partial [Ilumatobacteraceae bacterium]